MSNLFPVWNKWLYRFLLKALDWGRILGMLVLGLVMVVIFAIGIFKVSAATIVLVNVVIRNSKEGSMIPATDFLKGLEYFFLAPLGLLTFKCLFKYVKAQVEGASQEVKIAEHDKEVAEIELHRLKGLIASLIAAILATDLVSKVILGASSPSLSGLAAELGVFVAMILYVLTLSRASQPPA